MDSKLFTLHTIETFWNKIKNKFYVKPVNGIPKSDLDTTVQSSLSKADSALQEHQDISGKQDKSTAVTHSANTSVGSATKPVYVAANGAATPISHSINSDVPANAKFTDTTYSDATQSTHGLMTAADKKKLDGMDLSKYLPKDGTAVAAAKLSTARKINTIPFDGTKDITIPRSRSLVHQATGINGSTGYVAVATLTVEATYCNLPGFIRYRNRGRAIVDLTFRFKNAGTNDPELDFARMDFDVNAAERAYLYKSDTATWTLYISKAEKYDGIEIMDCQPPTGIDITFTNGHASSLPSGTVAFTQHNRANESSTVAAAKTLTDSGWIIPTFPSGIKNSTIRYRKQGKIVSVSGYVIFSESASAKVVLTLPEGYRPPAKIQQFNAVDSSAQASFLTTIDTNGKLSFVGKTQGFFDTTSSYYIHCTFFVD